MWVQIAGALAEAGVGLKEITERVSMVAKAMGECQPRGWEAGREEEADLGSRNRFPAAANRACQVIPQGMREGLSGRAMGTGSLGFQS